MQQLSSQISIGHGDIGIPPEQLNLFSLPQMMKVKNNWVWIPLPPCLLTHRSHVREKKRADRGGVVRSTEGWGQNVVLLNVAVFRMF